MKVDLRQPTTLIRCMLFSATLGIAACSGGSDDTQQALQQQAAKARRARQQTQPEDPLARMVRAVTPSKGELPIDVRFELQQRPEPGKPVDIKLALVPSTDLAALQAVVKSAAGLQIADNTQIKFDTLKSGEMKDYTFAATPSGTGIFIASVDVTVTRETGDNTYTYSIPVAVPAAH